MGSKTLLVSTAVILLALNSVPVSAQNPFPPNFYRFDFLPEPPPVPPVPPLPPLPPMPVHIEPFHFNFGQQSKASADPQTALLQEVFRSLVRTAPDRALDIATERLKADPADPVVLANLSAIAQSNSAKALPLLISIAKTSTNVDSKRGAMAALARRNDKDGLGMLEDLYNSSTADVEMRQLAVQYIGRIPDAGAVAVLARIAKSDPDMSVRRSAARYLGNRNEPDVNKVLEDLLRPTK